MTVIKEKLVQFKRIMLSSALLALFIPTSYAWETIHLTGTDCLGGYCGSSGPDPQGYGDNGFYLGKEKSYDYGGSWDHYETIRNFNWVDVPLHFSANGDAHASFDMPVQGNPGETWGFDMHLKNIGYSWKGDWNIYYDGVGWEYNDYQGSAMDGGFNVAYIDKLFAGEKFGDLPEEGIHYDLDGIPGGDYIKHADIEEWGLGWHDIEITLTKPDGTKIEDLGNYKMHHYYTAELHWDESVDAVTFELWTAQDPAYDEHGSIWRRYWGDTKAHAHKPPPPPPGVPVPGTALLLGLGLIMMRARKRK